MCAVHPDLMGTSGGQLNAQMCMGAEALEWEGERTHGGQYAREWLRSKGNSIEGGTSEIMLDIVAAHVLELPRG